MEIREIAEACLDIWRKDDSTARWFETIEKFYGEDAVNVEPTNWGELPSEAVGKEAIIEKYKFNAAELVERDFEFQGPYYSGDRFAVRIAGHLTVNKTGQQAAFSEIGLFTVKDGKIVREEFLYGDELAGLLAALNESTEKKDT